MLYQIDSLVGNTSVCIACIIILVAIVYLNRKHIIHNNVSPYSGTGYLVFWFVFALFSTLYCPIGGDNVATMDAVYYPYVTNGTKHHFEPIYFLCMDVVPNSYVLWRFFVWGILGGGSFVILCKMLKLEAPIATVACCTLALPIIFYYQRAVCGYCLLYIGVAIFVSREDVGILKKVLVCLSLSLLSLCFHTAMPFYLILAIISIFCPLNKTSLLILAISFLVISNSLINYAVAFLNQTSEETFETGMRYLENAYVLDRNIAGILFQLVQKLPVYCMLLYCTYQHISGKHVLSSSQKVFLLNTILLIASSLLFSKTSETYEVKFYRFAMIPWTLFIAQYFQENRSSISCNFYAYGTLAEILLINGYRIYTGTFFNIV